MPPLILTSSTAAPGASSRLGSLAEIVVASGADPEAVDNAAVLKILAGRKLFRVLAEGGPSLLGSLIQADLLDELCLTIAPLLVGGSASRVATGHAAVHSRMRRIHLLSDNAGYLYARYIRGH